MCAGHFVGCFVLDGTAATDRDATAVMGRAIASCVHRADLVALEGGHGVFAAERATGRGGSCRDTWSRPGGDGFAFIDGAWSDEHWVNLRKLAGADGPPSPASVLLAAYRRWGLACVDRLHADFALIVWRPGAPLYCAVSPGGARWLYYRTAERTLWVADHPGLLLDTDRPRGDRAFFANQAQGCFSGDRTPFEDIRRLRPGYVLKADHAGIVETRWWNPPQPGSLRLTRKGYQRELRRALQAAVARHMHGHRRVCIALSGGVDSGAVAACAREVASATGTELLALTFSTPEDALADEAPAAREAAARIGVTHRAVTVDGDPIDALLDTAARLPFPTGHVIFGQPLVALARAAREWGATLLLNGAGGELHAGSFEYLLDLYRTRRYARLLAEIAQWWSRGYPLSRMGLDLVARAQAGSRPDNPSARTYPWLRLQPAQAAANGATHPMLSELERFLSQEGTGLEMHHAIYARYGVEPAAPHLDRRVMELALGMPLELRVARQAGSLNKPLLRSAFPEVSDEVCRRADRANLGEYAARAWISSSIDRLLPGWLARRSSLVDDVLDRERLERDLVKLRQSSEQMSMAEVASAAIWLEAMDRLGLSLT